MSIKSCICGKNKSPEGITPAVALINPKNARNVGAILRACSCFGVNQLWWTGKRVQLDIERGTRLPREERMKGYRDVEMRQYDRIFDEFPKATPVAIEVRENSEILTEFEHPENPLYVFGPEDGSIDSKYLRHCHRFVVIPSKHCTNLAAAVYIVLYDRLMKQCRDGKIDPYSFVPGNAEERGLDKEYMEAIG